MFVSMSAAAPRPLRVFSHERARWLRCPLLRHPRLARYAAVRAVAERICERSKLQVMSLQLLLQFAADFAFDSAAVSLETTVIILPDLLPLTIGIIGELFG